MPVRGCYSHDHTSPSTGSVLIPPPRRRKLKCDRELPCFQCARAPRICRYAEFVDTSYDSDQSDVESTRLSVKRSRHSIGDVHNGRPSSRRGSLATLPENPPGLGDVYARLERLERAVLGSNAPARGHGAPVTLQPRRRRPDSDGLPSQDPTFLSLVRDFLVSCFKERY
jgi:hypothetical protein